ncbi:class A beta-lactamase [Xenorhabdus sp. XENO-1]|uniref:class A beta-lactamase n=1 Tax=Xenorhabdus bovienii TaxID=40576 RepID=UPI0020CA32AE|nr:class A beta-lactamase [Xenorhabdus bovienii]MCP9270251.1 class A beta-lactamase [Xenorhabdus bovienii subsp. africana]
MSNDEILNTLLAKKSVTLKNITSNLKHMPAVILCFFFISNANASMLKDKIKTLEIQGWQVGVSILDYNGNKIESVNGDERFPLDSTVKALACANILAKVDNKSLRLEDSVLIKEKDIVTYSPITEGYVNKKITLKQACEATTAFSDNTAANIAISSIGGPSELTKFMRSIGDNTTRSDRYEPDLTINPEHDLRDTTTPNAMSNSIRKLLTGNVLSKKSKEQLKEWMIGNKVADNMLRSGLPKGWFIADRSGASDYGIRGITSMVWSDKEPPLFISIYVRKSNTSLEERSEKIAEIGMVIFSKYTH